MPQAVLCSAMLCRVEMCCAALNYAVRYFIVDQIVLGVTLLTELIWILNSSCLNV